MKKYGIIPYVVDKYADVAELADARDLKSRGKKFPYRFDPGHRHQTPYIRLPAEEVAEGIEVPQKRYKLCITAFRISEYSTGDTKAFEAF